MSIQYIISQVFVVVSYLLLAATYLVKNRKLLLILNVTAMLTTAAAYFFLSAWSGLVVCGIALLRNAILLIQNHYDKDKRNKVVNWSIFIFLTATLAVSGYFTYNGVLSLFSVIATFVYTVSIWQKNQIVYKTLGIVCSVFCIIYNVFVWSVLGVVCEGLLMIVEIVALILALLNLKKQKKQTGVNEETNTIK